VLIQRFIRRSSQALTWPNVIALTLFCGVFGLLLSLDPDTGGIATSVGSYLSGCMGAFKLFVPALIALTLAACFAPSRFDLRVLTLGAAVTIGIAIGYCLLMLGIPALIAGWHENRVELLTRPLPFVELGWLGLFVYLLEERQQLATQSLHDEGQKQLELERQMSEAQLQVLQAQVEPHFLFNTLAHVRRLYMTAPPAARMMTRDLVNYLGAVVPVLGSRGIKLEEDVGLAVAYLNLQKVRMGARLRFEVDVPSAAEDVQVPPMMVTTLVENAIKHGLSPLPSGGEIRISAVVEADRVSIEVFDSGQGLRESLGSGVGLANTRARLTILHGPTAELQLSRNTPSGVKVTVLIPRLCSQPGAA
jgi:sensor histidine kinase YesM